MADLIAWRQALGIRSDEVVAYEGRTADGPEYRVSVRETWVEGRGRHVRHYFAFRIDGHRLVPIGEPQRTRTGAYAVAERFHVERLEAGCG